MQKLREGVQQFQQKGFPELASLFEELGRGQKPETLFITCSDSRIDPNLITHTKPGDLFVVRNAGNIVPPHKAANGGEAATIEYAVAALGVRNIVVCGHSQCGAMKGLLDPPSVAALPAVAEWLEHTQATQRVMSENYKELQGDELLAKTVEQNVLAQLANLRTLPAVAARLQKNEVRLYGWVYKFETGEVFAYQPEQNQFVLLADYKDADDAETGTGKAL